MTTSFVAIVGRPNVGKSTLFNRLSRSRDSLVDDAPGITRDRLYASIHWEGTSLTIIDTGGFDNLQEEPLMHQVRSQVEEAIREADRIIFMVDGPQGAMPGDEDITRILRRTDKMIFLAVNKIDGVEHEGMASEFYSLGWDKVYSISAAHGYGIKALMADVIRGLPKPVPEREDSDRIRVAMIGRPNAGKSSLINRILGFERLIVNDMPGTTRDSVDTHFTWKGKEYLFIDTAGIRRKSKVNKKIEKFSVMKALKSLDRCHVAIILLDAAAGIAEQDARICGYAYEKGRGMILAVNKWDLIKKNLEQRRHLERTFELKLKFASFAPRINLSALTGEGVESLLQYIDLVYGQFCTRVGTSAVNDAISEMIQKKPPPQVGRSRLKIFYATQTGIKPPTFVIFVNRPELIHFSYERFILNQMREHFDLKNTPLQLIFKKREKNQK
ncbi:MAG: ribosome biogenesis GTPase Der [Deltaproteobacteria bacterium]|nr:ribosome biogenesis GTPase Der [Deltaproteobacteria bacterium]